MGVWVRGCTLCHQRLPGTAPSRLKAYSILRRVGVVVVEGVMEAQQATFSLN